jgi:hypothetical protein
MIDFIVIPMLVILWVLIGIFIFGLVLCAIDSATGGGR